ncbi:MAG: diguanylate cyclase [Desulfovibrio sp.]|nr:diguanylate cyclase [Desulfovibrio sp.]
MSRHLASAIQSILFRSPGAVFRYGGEEFAIILKNGSPGQAVASKKRHRHLLQTGAAAGYGL